MAYTAVDLDNVRAAKLALATGQRTVSVTFADRSVTYGQADLAALTALEGQILRALALQPRQFQVFASKGFF